MQDMVKLELLERLNQHNYKIINHKKSAKAESGALANIIVSGEYREQYQKDYQKKIRNNKKKDGGHVFVFV